MKRRLIACVAVVLVAGWVSGCGQKHAEPPPLTIAAASDLQSVMPVLISRFQLDTGIKIEPVFGASGALAKQVRSGGPFDVFLAANRGFVDDLAKDGLVVTDSVRPYARGSLVMAIYDLANPPVKTLADLASDKIKHVAIANPDTAPYGAAAKQALERAGIWAAVQPKLAIAENIREAHKFVETGNCEVGLVSRAIGKTKGVRLIPLAPDVCDPIVQAMGVVKSSKRQTEAEQFCTFILSEDGQGILREFGFLTIESQK